MGLYDTFRSKDHSVELQVKAGPCDMENYTTGDKVHHSYMKDCVIHAYGGSVLIRNHVVIAVSSEDLRIEDVPHIDKWGNVYTWGTNLDEVNPVLQAMDEEESRQLDAIEAARNDLYNKWADRLRSVLTDDEFLEFAEFMDSCDDVAFSGYLADRAAKIAPEQYITDNDLDEETKRKVEV